MLQIKELAGRDFVRRLAIAEPSQANHTHALVTEAALYGLSEAVAEILSPETSRIMPDEDFTLIADLKIHEIAYRIGRAEGALQVAASADREAVALALVDDYRRAARGWIAVCRHAYRAFVDESQEVDLETLPAEERESIREQLDEFSAALAEDKFYRGVADGAARSWGEEHAGGLVEGLAEEARGMLSDKARGVTELQSRYAVVQAAMEAEGETTRRHLLSAMEREALTAALRTAARHLLLDSVREAGETSATVEDVLEQAHCALSRGLALGQLIEDTAYTALRIVALAQPVSRRDPDVIRAARQQTLP